MRRWFLTFLPWMAFGGLLLGMGAPVGSDSDSVPAFRLKGPAKAPVTLLEFSDFECPQCAMVQAPLNDLLAHYPEKIRLVFRHYPLTMHRWAFDAALAAESAGRQGKFWEYSDFLYSRQKEWSKAPEPHPFFIQYAQSLGLDLDRFDKDRRSVGLEKAIREDRSLGNDRNIHATPTLFVNGQRLVGDSQFRANAESLVRAALGLSTAPAHGAP